MILTILCKTWQSNFFLEGEEGSELLTDSIDLLFTIGKKGGKVTPLTI